jgi:hypothetical protein
MSGWSAAKSRRAVSLALLLLAVVAVVGPARAATSTKYYGLALSTPTDPVAGGSTTTYTFNLRNCGGGSSSDCSPTSTQTLGSADITVPQGFTLTPSSIVSTTPPGGLLWTTCLGDGFTCNAAPNNVLQLRANSSRDAIAPGQSVTLKVNATAPCLGGTYKWVSSAKQSNSYSGPPGNNFTNSNQQDPTTTISGNGCKLVWRYEPGDGVVNTDLTGISLDGSTTGAIEVDAVGSDGVTPVTSAAGTVVSLATTAPSFGTAGSCPFSETDASSASPPTATLDANGAATFPHLQSNCTGVGFKLTASASGFTSAENPHPFNVYISVTECPSGSLTCTSQPVVVGGNTETVTGNTDSGNFLSLGVGVEDLKYTPTGCQNFNKVSPDDVPIVVVDTRTMVAGELNVSYGVKISAIKKKYANTSGQQFIPICVGAMRIALGTNGKTYSVPCNEDYPGAQPQATKTDPSATGWWGKTLDNNGAFVPNSVSRAVCDPMTGYFFGIVGSFQDYTASNGNPTIDPNNNPTVTSWGGDGTNTYRVFKIRFPSSSLTGSSDPSSFRDVPWDGWNAG